MCWQSGGAVGIVGVEVAFVKLRVGQTSLKLRRLKEVGLLRL